MNDSDLRDLMFPDDELLQERHARIKERVMASVRTDEPVSRPRATRPSRFRRRLVPALVSLSILASAGTAVAFAFGVFPQHVQSALEELGCRDSSSVEQLVATAEVPDGRQQQFWITKAGENSRPNGHILIDVTADGEYLGSTFGCGAPSLVVEESDYDLFVVAASESSVDGTLLIVLGHAPPEAITAIVTFDDATVTSIEVGDEGYFLGLVERPDIVPDSSGNVRPPDVTKLAAVDTNGMVIAELDI